MRQLRDGSESSHSDQYSQREIVKSVEMLKKLECFGFFRAFFWVFFGDIDHFSARKQSLSRKGIVGGHLVPVRQSRFSNFFLTKMQDACRSVCRFLQGMRQQVKNNFFIMYLNIV